MNLQEKALCFLIKLCRFSFGEFELNEFRKFLQMGFIFTIIIGVYWTLRPLKDSLFMQLVDKVDLPFAKTLSVIALIPFLMLYTKFLGQSSREKMLLRLPAYYGVITLCFSAIMFVVQGSPEEISARSIVLSIGTKILGYAWYIYVESFGSLLVPLFWVFATDTTKAFSAEKGFPFIVAFGQIGGIIFPYSIGGLPHRLSLETDSLSIGILGLLTFTIIPLVRHFLKTTPEHLLSSFTKKNENVMLTVQSGFLEGLRLMIRHKYLLCIFGVNLIYGTILTIIDFNFKFMAGSIYEGVALSNYLSLYGSCINIVTFGCLILGISNLTRFLGIPFVLILIPIIVGIIFFGFLMFESLSILFALVIALRGINYALSGPTLKQLYIPTTETTRFKAQAWIEAFGSRSAKEAGSLFNMLLRPLQSSFGAVMGREIYLSIAGFVGFSLLILWEVNAVYLVPERKDQIL
ncbi:MAG: hypothetical protein B7Y25_00595 [Alphaproteobacteria bacterium 16-39-46]|nr:MAG: hypothetical protein B7Y25_00595 [Alphaproteobacteria bacterium 16-39-46]OZA44401.1 MAG: hypothetical protein B7X84_00320 [Alphaproteobacteria bacterium 17-39-52]HQS83286.1 Npt1/Npt2 family nucleotide transporter [Alphaproteobacteria bacterium]HQS93172.1 Npt1/Npt2 family nucleotide transporter [Alphaproteobacteria bacterium]